MSQELRKLVILCFPGWRTSAIVLQNQLRYSGISELLKDYAEFICVNPALLASGDPEPSVLKLAPGPYYQWWSLREDPSGKLENLRYEYLEETCNYVTTKIVETIDVYGHLDGFLGFSQGAACVMLYFLLDLVERVRSPVKPKFFIIISGLLSDELLLQLSLNGTNKLDVPSLHLTGTKDGIHDRSLQAARDHFISPTVLIHAQGHVVPKLSKESLELSQAFFRFFDVMYDKIINNGKNNTRTNGSMISTKKTSLIRKQVAKDFSRL